MPRNALTPAQRRALEAIRDGEVTHSRLAAHAFGYNPWRLPARVRRDTVERVIRRDWARLGPHGESGSATAELTDLGRAALNA